MPPRLIIGRHLMGHIAKPDFIIAFGENSAIDVKFSFYLLELISSKELPVEEAYS